MPELAEVEYYRKCWDCGLGEKITGLKLHPKNRIFRSVQVNQMHRLLPGVALVSSEARGKQMLFRFENQLWLGVHLGMTGKLRVAPPDCVPDKHDHLVLYQRRRALVFTDPRQFGRIQFAAGAGVPAWWARLPEPLTARCFNAAALQRFLGRHPRLSIKAALLHQTGFPGIGNWMADEILWRARLNPTRLVGSLDFAELVTLWRYVRLVCRGALRSVGVDFSDPPAGWLFHERWSRGGRCPIHGSELERGTVGGRTTVWCAICQPISGAPPGRS